MPPRRRTAASNGQSTLSFGTQSRVTKPSTAPLPGKNQKNQKPNVEQLVKEDTKEDISDSQEELTSQPSKPHIAELVVRQQAAEAIQEPRSKEDLKALKLSKQDLNRYWKNEEQSRMAPRG